MTIDKLSRDTILVTLMSDDMERYKLDFSAAEDEARSGLRLLMLRVGEECGLDHSDKSYLIEALPGGDGCLLIISVRSVRRRRVFRVKKVRRIACCGFVDADALLDFLNLGQRFAYSVYRTGSGYELLPELPLSHRLRGLLNEYGRVRELSAVQTARVRELGELILSRGDSRPRPRVTDRNAGHNN